ncbi:Glucan endo-1,3-beta-glucosidase 5 [Glycine soja]
MNGQIHTHPSSNTQKHQRLRQSWLNFWKEYAFLNATSDSLIDKKITYTNAFDGNLDTLAEPFGTVNSGVEGGEERVVELLVHDLGGEHDRKGAVVEFGERKVKSILDKCCSVYSPVRIGIYKHCKQNLLAIPRGYSLFPSVASLHIMAKVCRPLGVPLWSGISHSSVVIKCLLLLERFGWPTYRAKRANNSKAERFYQGLIYRINQKKGPPRRLNEMPDVYIFGLLDENAKSIELGVKYLKKQWCVLSQDANINDPKMEDNLKIACEGLTGCTTLGNIMGHLEASITDKDLSPPSGACKFEVGIEVVEQLDTSPSPEPTTTKPNHNRPSLGHQTLGPRSPWQWKLGNQT